MNLIELIFQLLKNFVPMETARFASLQMDGTKWYNEIDPADASTNPLLAKFKAMADLWFVQVGIACSFIFLNKYIHDFMTSAEDEDEDDE